MTIIRTEGEDEVMFIGNAERQTYLEELRNRSPATVSEQTCAPIKEGRDVYRIGAFGVFNNAVVSS